MVIGHLVSSNLLVTINKKGLTLCPKVNVLDICKGVKCMGDPWTYQGESLRSTNFENIFLGP
jgi:hypothetical protein